MNQSEILLIAITLTAGFITFLAVLIDPVSRKYSLDFFKNLFNKTKKNYEHSTRN